MIKNTHVQKIHFGTERVMMHLTFVNDQRQITLQITTEYKNIIPGGLRGTSAECPTEPSLNIFQLGARFNPNVVNMSDVRI